MAIPVLGVYDTPSGKDKWISGGSRPSYGPNARLKLDEESGEIIESGRSLIRIHGGRQEEYDDKTGEWKRIDNATLKKTHRCMRTSDPATENTNPAVLLLNPGYKIIYSYATGSMIIFYSLNWVRPEIERGKWGKYP